MTKLCYLIENSKLQKLASKESNEIQNPSKLTKYIVPQKSKTFAQGSATVEEKSQSVKFDISGSW